MSKQRSKKGLNYQDAVADYINAMPGVGVGVEGEDARLADTYSVEVKNVQAGNFRAFMRQAEEQAEGERIPVVIAADFTKREKGKQVRRRSIGQSLIVMRLDDWLQLVKHADAPASNGYRTIYSFASSDLIAWGSEDSLTVSTFGSGTMKIEPRNEMVTITVDKGE